MVWGLGGHEVAEREAQSLEIPANGLAELPDDSGDVPYKAELPDDSGKCKTVELSNLPALSVLDVKERKLPEKMDSVTIRFRYPEGASETQKKEFDRQLKAQERGLNRQSVAENIENRQNYQLRKAETGNGRSPESSMAQQRVREKAIAQRIESNQNKGLSYGEAQKEAYEWIQKQAALHDPDQIAGGNPLKVSRMGDRNINSSIGSQWSSRVAQLEDAVNRFAKDYSKEELCQIKMNVRLGMS